MTEVLIFYAEEDRKLVDKFQHILAMYNNLKGFVIPDDLLPGASIPEETYHKMQNDFCVPIVTETYAKKCFDPSTSAGKEFVLIRQLGITLHPLMDKRIVNGEIDVSLPPGIELEKVRCEPFDKEKPEDGFKEMAETIKRVEEGSIDREIFMNEAVTICPPVGSLMGMTETVIEVLLTPVKAICNFSVWLASIGEKIDRDQLKK
jgi:hypothetical protein